MGIYGSRKKRASRKRPRKVAEAREIAPEIERKRASSKHPKTASKKAKSSKKQSKSSTARAERGKASSKISSARATKRKIGTKGKPAKKGATVKAPSKTSSARSKRASPGIKGKPAKKAWTVKVPPKLLKLTRRELDAAIARARAAQERKAAKDRARRKRTRAAEARAAQSRAEVEAQRKKERAAQRKPKKARAKIRKGRKKVEARRAKRELVTQDLPRETPKEERASRQTTFDDARPHFMEFVKLALSTGEAKTKRRFTRRVDSEHFVGEQVRIRIRRILAPENVEQILYIVDRAVRKLPGNRRSWLGKILASALGERLFGYDTRLIQLPTDRKAWPAHLVRMAHHFQASGVESTGVKSTYEGMLDELRDLLEEYAQTARTLVYVHHVDVMNYEMKRKRP